MKKNKPERMKKNKQIWLILHFSASRLENKFLKYFINCVIKFTMVNFIFVIFKYAYVYLCVGSAIFS